MAKTPSVGKAKGITLWKPTSKFPKKIEPFTLILEIIIIFLFHLFLQDFRDNIICIYVCTYDMTWNKIWYDCIKILYTDLLMMITPWGKIGLPLASAMLGCSAISSSLFGYNTKPSDEGTAVRSRECLQLQIALSKVRAEYQSQSNRMGHLLDMTHLFGNNDFVMRFIIKTAMNRNIFNFAYSWECTV